MWEPLDFGAVDDDLGPSPPQACLKSVAEVFQMGPSTGLLGVPNRQGLGHPHCQHNGLGASTQAKLLWPPKKQSPP